MRLHDDERQKRCRPDGGDDWHTDQQEYNKKDQPYQAETHDVRLSCLWKFVLGEVARSFRKVIRMDSMMCTTPIIKAMGIIAVNRGIINMLIGLLTEQLSMIIF